MQFGPKTEAALVAYRAMRDIFKEAAAPIQALDRRLEDARNVHNSLLRSLEGGTERLEDGREVLSAWREAAALVRKLEKERYPRSGPGSEQERRQKVRDGYFQARRVANNAFAEEHLDIEV